MGLHRACPSFGARRSAAVGVGRARCDRGLYLPLVGPRPLDALADRRPSSFSRTLVAPEQQASVWNTFLALGDS